MIGQELVSLLLPIPVPTITSAAAATSTTDLLVLATLQPMSVLRIVNKSREGRQRNLDNRAHWSLLVVFIKYGMVHS
jgi:hypothetical protein